MFSVTCYVYDDILPVTVTKVDNVVSLTFPTKFSNYHYYFNNTNTFTLLYIIEIFKHTQQ